MFWYRLATRQNSDSTTLASLIFGFHQANCHNSWTSSTETSTIPAGRINPLYLLTSSRHPCFLRSYIRWSHQLMIGLPRFGSLHQIPVPLPLDVNRCITIISLRSSCSSLLNQMRKSSTPALNRRSAASILYSAHARKKHE